MALESGVMVESPSGLSLGRNLRTGPSMFETPTPLKFRSNPLEMQVNRPDAKSFYRNESRPGIDGISHDFREALKTLSPDIKRSGINSAIPAITDSKHERIADAFHRGETLLLSNDNARPKSRCKTPLSINNLQKVTPTSDIELTSQKSDKHLHRYISDNNLTKIFGEVGNPALVPSKNDNSNNAQSEAEAIKNAIKKERKLKKRAKTSTVKARKSKQGRISIPSTGLQNSLDKKSSTPSVTSPSKPSPTRQRVSSEPPSKLSLSSVLSCAPHTFNNNHTASQLYPSLACNNKSRNLLSAPSGNSKPTLGNNTQNIIQYTLGNIASGNSPSQNFSDALQAQGKPLHKTEYSYRVKSGHSVRSYTTTSEEAIANSNKDSVKETGPLPQCEQLSLSAKPCNIHFTHKQSLSANAKRTESDSSEHPTKEAALTAIYGAVYQTANRVAAQIEELKKARKIFLSDRQSGTLKENGVEYPCAPPATPNPDVGRKYEYVPSMSDVRSQRAVKTRLQVMERDAQKKKEKQKETHAKQEKQLLKDREKYLRAQQRREIYALNKVMTELENKKFMEFCQAKGLNKA